MGTGGTAHGSRPRHANRLALHPARSRLGPVGPGGRDLEEALERAEDRGAVAALREALARSRRRCEEGGRAAVAQKLRDLQIASGLTQGEFARRLGTSRSRVNSHLNGRVTPSATVLVRARRVAAASGSARTVAQAD